ncbi:MAG: hypothetical protein WAW33_00225 [Minisyncoccia bacterium]
MQIFKTRTFLWWEIGLVKLCLISFGILLGLYFYGYLIGLTLLWWVLFIATAIYFVIRFFFKK